MFDCMKNKIVTLAWVPSHVNIGGNESADRLAKNSIGKNEIEYNVSFEHAEMHELIDKYIVKKWQEQWSKSQTGKHYQLIEPNVSCKIKFQCLNRQKEIKLTRMRLGQCRLHKYLYNIGCHSTGLCEYCGVEETLEHYLLQCGNCMLKYTARAACNKENIPFVLCNILKSTRVLDYIYPDIRRDL